MVRQIKDHWRYATLLALCCLILPGSVQGQARDLYSLESTRAFANYLFTKGDWTLAADEYARLLFMTPNDDTVLQRLSQIYRSQGKYPLAKQLFQLHRGQPPMLSTAALEREYLATQLFQGPTGGFTESLGHVRHLGPEEQLRMQIEFAMVNRDWLQARHNLAEAAPSRWKDVYSETTERVLAFGPKKPWLASAMSVVIPGSGKIYAKNVKEGITSFLFVAAMAYQSYRGFDKQGTKSATGWIYGGLGLGFYVGNIYGAQQSAKNYNRRQLADIHEEVDRIIDSRY